MNWVVFAASGIARVSAENTAMQVMSVTRRPTRSVTGPTSTAPMPTPTSPIVDAVVRLASVKPRSPVFDSTGMTAPSTTRSKPSRATASQHSHTAQAPERLRALVEAEEERVEGMGLDRGSRHSSASHLDLPLSGNSKVKAQAGQPV